MTAEVLRKTRYRMKYVLTLPNGEKINILAQPRESEAARAERLRNNRPPRNYLKLEYSPEKIRPEGKAILFERLATILGDTFREDFRRGRVDRADFTFDIRRTKLCNLWIEDTKGRKSDMIRGEDLNIQTLYFGYKSNRFLTVYDKREEREAAGGRPSSTTTQWIRFEYRYAKGNYTLDEITGPLRNPFKHFVVRKYREVPDLMPNTYSRLVFDACRLHGSAHVLDKSAAEDRAAIQAVIDSFPLHIDLREPVNAIWDQLGAVIDDLVPAPD
ncbi:MAG: hypothetical protein MZU95_13715 [Desulfomicrobium escambiense]|nr:hypothetical protein [Desulfomicrobium escambiense]